MAGGKFGGTFLKLFSTILYALLFCCAAVILGIYSYFLSVLADRNAPIPTWSKAVEGISGAAVLYLILAVILTCCLGGKIFFAFIAIVLDILFCGAFIAIAVLTRHGAGSCTGNVRTPFGNGPSNSKEGWEGGDGDQVTYAASLGTICRLNTAVFAVSLIGAFLFAVSAIVQLCLGRHHQKEKKFGPSPRNGYTRGSGGKFWQRKQKNQALRDPEMVGAVPATTTTHHTHGTHSHDGGIRPSHDTAYTGSTVGGTAGYENPHKPLAGGYHTAPTGTYNTHTSNTTSGYYNNNPTPATNY